MSEDAFEDELQRVFAEAARGYASPSATETRMRAERKANRTPKERDRFRRPKKTENLTCRCSDRTRRLVEALQHALGDVSIGVVLTKAVELLADKKKVSVE